MPRFNERLFRRAERAAHSWFWYSDCPTVKEWVQKKVETSGINYRTTADYTALVCHGAVIAEMLDAKRLRRKSRRKKKHG
jgi:hypothetical protein